MPRYFFHFTDGKRTIPDTMGVKLDGVAEVRQHLISHLGQLKDSIPEQQFQAWYKWFIVVETVEEEALMEMGFDLIEKGRTKEVA